MTEWFEWEIITAFNNIITHILLEKGIDVSGQKG